MPWHERAEHHPSASAARATPGNIESVKARVILAWAIPLAILGFAAWGYVQRRPSLDIANAVRAGDLARVNALLAADSSLARAKVYAQAYERADSKRVGARVWGGRYVIHEAVARYDDATPILAALAAAGADLQVRLDGRTLLHEAVRNGNLKVALWLLERGADVNAGNDCGACSGRGRTPLHDAQEAGSDAEMNEFLLTRGAAVDAVDAAGQNAVHAAAVLGSPAGAWVLCAHGADPTVKDASGRLPWEVARETDAVGRNPARTLLYGPGELADWLRPGGGCARLAAMARHAGAPVPEDQARAVFGVWACARGMKDACTPAPRDPG